MTLNWIASIAGGALIGLAAVLLWLLIGRIAGISGIAGRALHSLGRGRPRWPLAFLLGLGAGAWLVIYLSGSRPVPPEDFSPLWLLFAGLLVGFGTRLGSGCTSGHGVCGLSRFSLRSLTATGIFMVTAMLVATLLHG